MKIIAMSQKNKTAPEWGTVSKWLAAFFII